MEFIDQAPGTEIRVGEVKAVRNADGTWTESHVDGSPLDPHASEPCSPKAVNRSDLGLRRLQRDEKHSQGNPDQGIAPGGDGKCQGQYPPRRFCLKIQLLSVSLLLNGPEQN